MSTTPLSDNYSQKSYFITVFEHRSTFEPILNIINAVEWKCTWNGHVTTIIVPFNSKSAFWIHKANSFINTHFEYGNKNGHKKLSCNQIRTGGCDVSIYEIMPVDKTDWNSKQKLKQLPFREKLKQLLYKQKVRWMINNNGKKMKNKKLCVKN